MPIIFIGGNAVSTLDKARRLADDLARIAADGSPSADDLAAAPILDFWQPALRDGHAIFGIVNGHPRIPDDHTALTTDVFALDADAGWARTWSRFYRLGRPLDLDAGRRQ